MSWAWVVPSCSPRSIGLGDHRHAFDVANTLPNHSTLLLAGGVLNAVLVPQIAKASKHDDGGDDFVNRLLTLAIAIMAVATVAATLAAPLLISIYADPKWSSRHQGAGGLLRVHLPAADLLLRALHAARPGAQRARAVRGIHVGTGARQHRGHRRADLVFMLRGLPRGAPVGSWTPDDDLAAGRHGHARGSSPRHSSLSLPLRRIGFRYRPVWGFRGVGLGSASKVAGWTFAAIAISQLGFIVTSQVLTRADRLRRPCATIQGTGKIVYSNAFLLFMLPHSLITVSLVTALFTRLSHAAHAGRRADMVADLGRGLRMPAVMLIPVTFVGVLLGPVGHATHCSSTARSQARTPSAHVLVGDAASGWSPSAGSTSSSACSTPSRTPAPRSSCRSWSRLSPPPPTSARCSFAGPADRRRRRRRPDA